MIFVVRLNVKQEVVKGMQTLSTKEGKSSKEKVKLSKKKQQKQSRLNN